MLKNRKILLGVTGGIAAYKAIALASKFVKQGAEVKTIMTSNACKLVSPISFKAITHQNVATETFDPQGYIDHITLADWAELIVIAPATANMIGKIAGAIADDLLSTTILAATAPVLIVPAMNIHMYENPLVQANISKLKKHGYFFMEPEYGKLACGYEGKGRFPDIQEITNFAKTYLHFQQDMISKKILITTGASREYLDPMRFLSNRSSGKMGLELARAASIRGADVTLIHAAMEEKIPEYIKSLEAEVADKMHEVVMKDSTRHNIIIKTAAVADFTPLEKSDQKLKKSGSMNLQLKRTKDILFELGQKKNKDQLLIGFAAESENIIENARQKLKSKNLDLIAANDLKYAGENETFITLIDKDTEVVLQGDKFSVAHQILDNILKL